MDYFSDASGGVEGVVEVVGGGPRVEIRPEEVHRLLAVEAVVGGASSLIRPAAFLRCHSPALIAREPAKREKLPRSRTPSIGARSPGASSGSARRSAVRGL